MESLDEQEKGLDEPIGSNKMERDRSSYMEEKCKNQSDKEKRWIDKYGWWRSRENISKVIFFA